MRKFIFFVLALIFSCQAFAGPVKEIVFFGDSLTDDGNLLRVLKIIPKSPPYYKGRFSNGSTWAEHVGNYFYDKDYVKYSNYAYGGATAILHSLRTDPFVAPIILPAELESYLIREPFKDKSKILYGIWIGANDYLYERTDELDKLTNDVVANIVESITTLIAKGGQNFLILNLPDLSQTPYARAHDLVDRLNVISLMHNTKLTDAVMDLKTSHPNINFVYIDIYTLFVDILKNPDKYNQKYGTHVTDTTTVCWTGGMLGLHKTNQINLSHELRAALQGNNVILDKQFDIDSMSKTILNSPSLTTAYSVSKGYDEGNLPCNNPDGHLFWDELHPTAVIHRVLGQIIVETLQGHNLV